MTQSGYSMEDTLVFQEADDSLRAQALRLLESLQLPISDLDNKVALYALQQADRLLATGGLEWYGNSALLRSVGVDSAYQSRGLGQRMTRELERIAREAGVAAVYLLTTTAEAYFHRQGYASIPREETPEAIRQTSQFSSLCPSSAVVMRKWLENR